MFSPYDPNLRPGAHDLDPTGRQQPDPDVRYVSSSEATEQDRLGFTDRMALAAGIGCALLARLALILAAFGIVALVIYLFAHV